MKKVQKPFFAKLLESQKVEKANKEVKGGGGGIFCTAKTPSDVDDPVTHKYPSDGDDYATS
ncbi:MAG: microviridin/marinostatin family tricyclic proteinase inhibitor [Bacteroidota bacterium]